MKKTLAVFLVLVLVGTACMGLVTSAQAATKLSFTNAWVYTANGGALNVRTSMAAPANNLITRLPYGTEVNLTDTIGDWAYIQFVYNGKVRDGYAMVRYLRAIDPNDPKYQEAKKGKHSTDTTVVTPISFAGFKQVAPYTVMVTPSRASGFVNMRWAPSLAVDVMQKCYNGYALDVIAENNTWAQVRDNTTGMVGFMMRKFLISAPYGAAQAS